MNDDTVNIICDECIDIIEIDDNLCPWCLGCEHTCECEGLG